MKRWHELERFKHLYEAQRRTGRRPDEGEGRWRSIWAEPSSGDGSELSWRCVQGNFWHTADRTEPLSYFKSFPSFTSAQSSCDNTNQGTHTEENLSAIRVKDVCVPIRKLNQNICSHREEEEEEAEKKNPQLHLSMKNSRRHRFIMSLAHYQQQS